MTLDLKAKAEELAKWSHACCECLDAPMSDEIAETLEKALQEVQDATRRETLEEAAKIARDADHCDLPGHGCTQEIERNILALLTTPEKK